jgi:DNA-binding NarL/FixJ family response regulator
MKILAVDDHPVFLKGLVLLMNSMFPDAKVEQETTGIKAVERILDNDYDLVIVDYKLKDITGLEIVNRVREEKDCKFIMLTMYDDEEIATEAVNAGVDGYILKENTASDISSAVKKVFEGKKFIDKKFSSVGKNINGNSLSALSSLTVQEINILKMISKKMSSRDISEELDISVKTVENHRANISGKLTLSGSNSLIAFAIENKALINTLNN